MANFAHLFVVSSAVGSQGELDPDNPAIFKLGSLAPGATATVSSAASTDYWPKSHSELPLVWAYSTEPNSTPYNSHCTVNLVVSPPEADADGDGMPNVWELAHRLDPASGIDALVDSDGDGVPNLFEFVSGTDPQNAEIYFRITGVRTTPTNLVVRVPSAAGRYYGLERKADLLSGGWQTVTNGVPGTGEEIELTDPTAPETSPSAVYRATVSP